MRNVLPNPFMAMDEPESRFVLDEAALMEAIEPPPLFLQDNSAVRDFLLAEIFPARSSG